MYRRGVYVHEIVQAEILHLPRTTSRYSRPFVPLADPTNEKRRQLDHAQWHRTDSSPSLLLPRELRYPAGQAIPFIIYGSDASPETAPEVKLVRTTSVKTRAGTIQERQVISRGRQLETGAGGVMNGVIDTGEGGKEASWDVAGVGGVRYEIRFGDVVEAVELVTHEWRGENTSGLPALGLGATGRRALHLIDMGT
ncbi:hypothetical protein FRC06_008428 [Ceratobasidium sp. 370]|nr:hypothetical protein FRC06_008428 [Ceratobasidium sp. 370]